MSVYLNTDNRNLSLILAKVRIEYFVKLVALVRPVITTGTIRQFNIAKIIIIRSTIIYYSLATGRKKLILN